MSAIHSGIVSSPPELLVPRARSSRKACHAEGFCNAVADMLALDQKIAPPPSGADPFYVHTFPKERLAKTDTPFDGITWRVVSSVPFASDNAGGRVLRKPLEVVVGPDPDAAGYLLKNQVWMEVATVEFTIWSRSSDTCSELINWFHRRLQFYANTLKFFEARGADLFQFVGRGEDEDTTRENQEVRFGTLTYQFRIQQITQFSTRLIEQIDVTAQIDNDQLTFTIPAQVEQ